MRDGFCERPLVGGGFYFTVLRCELRRLMGFLARGVRADEFPADAVRAGILFDDVHLARFHVQAIDFDLRSRVALIDVPDLRRDEIEILHRLPEFDSVAVAAALADLIHYVSLVVGQKLPGRRSLQSSRRAFDADFVIPLRQFGSQFYLCHVRFPFVSKSTRSAASRAARTAASRRAARRPLGSVSGVRTHWALKLDSRRESRARI